MPEISLVPVPALADKKVGGLTLQSGWEARKNTI
jgi:hypothetical protein